MGIGDFDVPIGGRPVRKRRRSIVGPVLLIGLGVLLLAQNFDLLPADFWLSLWHLWPLLLVLAGVELILGRASWGSVVSVALLALVLAVIAGAGSFLGQMSQVFPIDRMGGSSFGDWSFGMPGSTLTQRLTEELGDERLAIVDLRHGAGRVAVTALSGDSTRLVDAELTHGENATVDRDVERRGDQVQVRLHGRTDRGNLFSFFGSGYREDWTVQLSSRVPIDLRVRTGASELDLNLSELVVTRLDVQAGASEVKITMPQAGGRTEARIRAGAADVEVTIPPGVAARIHPRGGLSDTTVDRTRFSKVGNYYQSPDYDTAANRVNLEVETGVSDLTIR